MEYTIKPELAMKLFPIARKALEDAAADPTSALAQGALEQARQQIHDLTEQARREDVLARLVDLLQDLNLLPEDVLLDLIHAALAVRPGSALRSVLERVQLLLMPVEIVHFTPQPSRKLGDIRIDPKPVRKRGKRKATRR